MRKTIRILASRKHKKLKNSKTYFARDTICCLIEDLSAQEEGELP